MDFIRHFYVVVLAVGSLAATAHAAPPSQTQFDHVRERADGAFEELDRTLDGSADDVLKDTASEGVENPPKNTDSNGSKDGQLDPAGSGEGLKPQRPNEPEPKRTMPQSHPQVNPPPAWDPAVDPGFEGTEPVWDPAVDPANSSSNLEVSEPRVFDKEHGASPARHAFLDLMPLEEHTTLPKAAPSVHRRDVRVNAPYAGLFLDAVARHFVSAAMNEILTNQNNSRAKRQNRARKRSFKRAQRNKRRLKRRTNDARRRQKLRKRRARL